MDLPHFRYHPDPVRSGSIVSSTDVCKCCGQARGSIYKGSVYSTHEIEDAICPWCIADGSAHQKFKATFVDTEAFGEGVSEATQKEISQRTPGFASWQTEQWPACCGDATAFLTPTGLAEIRKSNYEWEGFLYDHVVHGMGISGGAARRLIESLHKDNGPTAYAFVCLHCNKHHFYIDSL